jgi:hypothetical protein
MEPRPTPSPPHGDSKRALLEARETFVRDEDERRTNSKDDGSGPKKSQLLPFLFLATAALGVYALVATPAWLITPPPPPESPVMVEASLRVAMWQEALYVERYRNEEGRLPVDLVEAGAPHVNGVFYHQVGDGSYLITGSSGQLDLVLRAEESFDDFLGESLKIISSRGES